MELKVFVIIGILLGNSSGYTELWGPWSHCSVTCGLGSLTRQRKCPTDDRCFENDTRTCIMKSCNELDVVAALYQDWSPWSTCSSDCGFGMTSRTRQCKLNTSDCNQNKTQTKSCFLRYCNVTVPAGEDLTGTLGTWNEWSECTLPCGGGQRNRTRIPSYNFAKIEQIQSQKCNIRRCSEEEASWEPWSEWTDCTMSCGESYRLRTRLCQGGIEEDKSCRGAGRDVENCPTMSCMEDQWQSWTHWSECSVTCGEGNRTRARTCGLDPALTGSCPGSSIEVGNCTKPDCRSASWSWWTLWSECSVTCGKGVRKRRRFCVSGYILRDNCLGLHKEEENCNLPKCKSHPSWSLWGSWSKCSTNCGFGWTTKTRICSEEGKLSGNCFGSGKRVKRCYSKCVERGIWSPWSRCSVSCGTGVRKRSASCSGGEKCREGKEIEEIPCTSAPCLSIYRKCGQAGNVRDVLSKYNVAKIVRGSDAAKGAWPWHVMMRKRESTIYEIFNKFTVGGSLLNENWVLTAAHNFYYLPNYQELILILGLTIKPKIGEQIGDEVNLVDISAVFIHENYSMRSKEFDYDIALVRLGSFYNVGPNGTLNKDPVKRTLKFSQYIRPICIPCISPLEENDYASTKHGVDIKTYKNSSCQAEGAKLVKKGHLAVVIGFGDMRSSIFQSDPMTLPNTLQQASLKILSRKACKKGEKKINQVVKEEKTKFTDRMICTRSSNKGQKKDACRGDSGGALMKKVLNSEGIEYWVQIGIISWGLGCASVINNTYSVPGYYTNVAKLAGWMTKVMDL